MDNVKAKSNSLSLASLIFGILALMGSVLIIPTPFTAGLAITFSWLSRGDKKLSNQAIAGNILAVIAIAVSLIVLIMLFSVIVLAAMHGADSILHAEW